MMQLQMNTWMSSNQTDWGHSDVFYLDALEAPALDDSKVLEPLDNYITPEFDIADFEPKLLMLFSRW